MTTMSTADSRRETDREKLAALIGLEPDILADQNRLLDELALDSLAMMRILTWMEERGVAMDARRSWPATVGDVLTLVKKAVAHRVSIRVPHNGEAIDIGPPAQPTTPVDPLIPVLATKTFRLLPILPDDIGNLYGLATRPETCFRWRYRGAPPPLDRFSSDLWQQVLIQFTVRTIEDNQFAGLVVAYNAGAAMRHVYVGAVFAPQHVGTGAAAQVTALFAQYLFHTFPLRKIYLEVPGFNWPQLQSGEGWLFDVEGILREHDVYAGQSWDQRICAIYPEAQHSNGAQHHPAGGH